MRNSAIIINGSARSVFQQVTYHGHDMRSKHLLKLALKTDEHWQFSRSEVIFKIITIWEAMQTDMSLFKSELTPSTASAGIYNENAGNI